MRYRIAPIGLAGIVLWAGCGMGYQVGKLDQTPKKTSVSASPAAAPKPLSGTTPGFPAQPQAMQSGPRAQPTGPSPPPGAMPKRGDSPQPASTPAASPVAWPAAEPVAIDLSAGVALPQATIDGTKMGFSVDYQFVQGEPHPSVPYVWVIQRAEGQPARLPVRLQAKGTLMAPVVPWRPEHGPFQTFIEDSGGRRVSPVEPLVVTGGF